MTSPDRRGVGTSVLRDGAGRLSASTYGNGADTGDSLIPAEYLAETAPKIVEASADAARARVAHAQAAGLIMQWHRFTAVEANQEIATQARELGVQPDALDTVIVRAVAHHFLADNSVYGLTASRPLPASRQPLPGWFPRVTNAAGGTAHLLSRVSGGLDQRSPSRWRARWAPRYGAVHERVGSGGDWFDLFAAADGRVALVIGDIEGHGCLAALAMTQLRTIVRTLAYSGDLNPVELCRRADDAFTALWLGLVASLFFGWLEAGPGDTAASRWCNAGHMPPIVVSIGGDVRMLQGSDDLLLGVGAELARSEHEQTLPCGSALLLFSDGLVETRARDLASGLTRLGDVARGLPTRFADQLCHDVVASMVADMSLDDATLLVVGVRSCATRTSLDGGTHVRR